MNVNVSRYVNTTELKFEVEFLTPTFLGGADENAEIRTAPFKEGIRYWWRILYGTKYFDLGKLKETEDLIFGSTENQSNVQLYIKTKTKDELFEKAGFPNGQRIEVSHQGRTMRVNILDYMAYGKYDYVKGNGNVYNVTHIKPKVKIRLDISIKDIGHTDEIIDSIRMFLSWGGIGSKSRNGFGSMDYKDLSEPKTSFSKKVLLSENLKQFPVFSELSKVFISSKPFNSWEEALSDVGIIYKKARSLLEKPHQYEKRGYVARPIEVKGEKNIPSNIKSGRIPKPFYLGIRKYENQFINYIICLPVEFYENKSQSEYLKVYNKMTEYFSGKMKENTDSFVKQFTGVQK